MSPSVKGERASMKKRLPGRAVFVFGMALAIILFVTGCGGGAPDNAITISYTLPVVPITFSFDISGHISVSVSANIVTELGELEISAGSSISTFPTSDPDNSLILTIRHKEDGKLVDTVYQIDTGGVGGADVRGSNISEVKIGWNGKNNYIFIDASHGDITSITINGKAAKTTFLPWIAAIQVPSSILLRMQVET